MRRDEHNFVLDNIEKLKDFNIDLIYIIFTYFINYGRKKVIEGIRYILLSFNCLPSIHTLIYRL